MAVLANVTYRNLKFQNLKCLKYWNVAQHVTYGNETSKHYSYNSDSFSTKLFYLFSVTDLFIERVKF